MLFTEKKTKRGLLCYCVITYIFLTHTGNLSWCCFIVSFCLMVGTGPLTNTVKRNVYTNCA